MREFDISSHYRILEKRETERPGETGFLLEHVRSGARIFLVSCQDENKVFMISFRTPPKDSRGTPHIMEHSVLCGSEKFPLKDPFVELAKGSLNTFLNAMTYPDKTVYPVASCNDADFKNLMDVYMDAVLNPRIYDEKKIFLQEGWHYEAESADSDAFINGVVYNEMKGVYSSPDGVLDRVTAQALFPDTCYGEDSGGDPEDIPDLTYDAFLNFHRTYYHPSNSYIYLYGDMDMAERLEWLDTEYLSKYERKQVDSDILEQKPFAGQRRLEAAYASEGKEEEESYLSWNVVLEKVPDMNMSMAMQVLEYVLLEAPGAPVRQALIDAGIGSDIAGGYEGDIMQPYFSVTAREADAGREEDFVRIIRQTLKGLVEGGIDNKSLKAAINYYEFKYREGDFGSTPRGLIVGLNCMETWLYGGDPFSRLFYLESFSVLKKWAESHVFEDIIEKNFLENSHAALVVLKPDAKKDEAAAHALEEKLKKYTESIGEEGRKQLFLDCAELKKYQDTPSTPEVLRMLPLLKRSDIKREAPWFETKKTELGQNSLLCHEYDTCGIVYTRFMFDITGFCGEDIFLAGALRAVLGLLDTEKHGYMELANEIMLATGGIDFSVDTFRDARDADVFHAYFTVAQRAFAERLEDGLCLIKEIIMQTVYGDKKRMMEVLKELRTSLKLRLESAGHSTAVMRAAAYISAEAAFSEKTGGTEFLRYIDRVIEENAPEKFAEKLIETAKKIFIKENLLADATYSPADREKVEEACRTFANALPQGCALRGEAAAFAEDKKNEGLVIPSQVNYVARCGNFLKKGLEYTGALKVLQVLLGYEYLWINVRVKGGAYGCMCGFSRCGDGHMVSYRDPQAKKTNDIFENVPAYLESFDADERDMTKYVLGAVAGMDMPRTARALGRLALSAYISGVTREDLQRERDEVLDAGRDDIRALAPYMQAILSDGAICAVGGEKKLSEDREIFKKTERLL